MAAAAVDFRSLEQSPGTSGFDPLDADVSSTNAETVRCESLCISYKDPYTKNEERLTEDVFLDPRDSWCGPGGILFITANALTALQKDLDKRYNYFRGSQETVDTCRHDYMRELQYLIEELHSMKRRGGVRNSDAEAIDALLERALEQKDRAATVSEEYDKDEIAEIVNGCGPRVESDEELIKHLELNGLSRKCELTLRILLKQMHLGTDDLIAERERLLKILGPIEGEKGGSEKTVDALLAAASGEGATICDLILAIQDHMRTDEARQAIEDVVTEKLRMRYRSLEEKYAELMPKLESWRVTLADSEEREARLFYLNEESKELEAEVKAREELEAAKREAWEAKNDPKKKAMLIQMKAQDTSNLSKEDGDKLRSMMLAEEKCEKDCAEMREAIAKSEEDIESYHVKKATMEEMFPDLERQHRYAEEDIVASEQKLEAAEAREKAIFDEELAMVKQRELLEDEYAAALAPPPKNTELLRLEEQLQETEERNAELRVAEENIYEKERRYEDMCANANRAWKEEEEAMAAAEARRQAEKEEEEIANGSRPATSQANARQLIEDPLMLNYPERYQFPEFSSQERYVNLYTDVRARERRMTKKRTEILALEAEKIVKGAESVGVFGAGFAAPTQATAHVPALFRRPEDLRVRLAGSEITVGHVDRILSEHQTHTSQLATNLKSISSQIGSYGAESHRLHTEARMHLTSVQNGSTGADADFPESVLSRDLACALQEHQVALVHAEQAWQQAEHLCERNIGEAQVFSDEMSCAVLERDLTASTRVLYTTASQAASDAPGPLAEPAQRCVLGLQAAEPQLAAAGAARSALWPRAAQLAERLHWERQVQDGLESFLRDETTRRDLFDKEVKAPIGEAKRAFASMRAAIGAGLPSSIAEPPASAVSGAAVKSTARKEGRMLEMAGISKDA